MGPEIELEKVDSVDKESREKPLVID